MLTARPEAEEEVLKPIAETEVIPAEPTPVESPQPEPEVLHQEPEAEADSILSEDSKFTSPLDISRDELEGKTVGELRNIARKLHMGAMTKNEIKFAKKDQLIQAICKFSEGDRQ